MDDEHGSREFAAEGAVVEIGKHGGARFARVLVHGGAVLQVPAGSIDIGVGDCVVVDAPLAVEAALASGGETTSGSGSRP